MMEVEIDKETEKLIMEIDSDINPYSTEYQRETVEMILRKFDRDLTESVISPLVDELREL